MSSPRRPRGDPLGARIGLAGRNRGRRGRARGRLVAELTNDIDLDRWPEGTRLICRRERPHPGAQFEIFDAAGYRHTAFLTDQPGS
jgi:hypothetical protein